MRLAINYQKCRKAGQCMYLHPELFKSDDSGSPIVLIDQPGEEMHEAAEQAAELCPNGAIVVREDPSPRGHA